MGIQENILMVFSIYLISVEGGLPSYLKKCKHDKTVAACIKANIPAIQSHISSGIKELAIPPLNPFHLKELLIDVDEHLTIKLMDLDVWHLDEFEFVDMKTNVDTCNGEIDLAFKILVISGIYEMDGKMLLLNIQGHGPANISMTNVKVNFKYTYTPIVKNDKKYANLGNEVFEFHMGGLHLQFDNLFNGDKELGDHINSVLNENWKDVEEILRPGINKAVIEVVKGIFHQFTENNPLDDLLIMV